MRCYWRPTGVNVPVTFGESTVLQIYGCLTLLRTTTTPADGPYDNRANADGAFCHIFVPAVIGRAYDSQCHVSESVTFHAPINRYDNDCILVHFEGEYPSTMQSQK